MVSPLHASSGIMQRKRMARARRSPTTSKSRRLELLEGSRNLKPGGRRVERKIRTLQRLVPGGGEPAGLDEIFRQAADYIVCLEMQVKVMQTMVDALEAQGMCSD